MDTFFNPEGQSRSALEAGGSFLPDFKASGPTAGRDPAPELGAEKRRSFLLYAFAGTALTLLGILAAVFVLRITKPHI